MNDRERFLACVSGEPVDRPPFWLNWAPWPTTWARWKREGLPGPWESVHDVRAHFGAAREPHTVPVNYGPCPRIEKRILEEDDEYYVWTETWGIKRRNPKDHESMSQFLEFPVRTRADWQRFKTEWLDPEHPERLAGDWRRQVARWIDAGYPIQIGCYPDVGMYGSVRWLLGDEECLLAFYDAPDLVHEIMEHMTDVYLAVFEKVAAEVRVDVIHIWEDMCGRQGPLISPAHWDEFLGPCYRRVKRFAADHGIRVISVDTDGNPERIIPSMMAGGVNYLLPMEVAAGCDVNAIQARFPKLAMMGGIDKRALAAGPAAIDAELERLRPAIDRGRYIPTLDHLVPDDVSWANYCYYADKLRQILGA
jgi:uroporphyrinogen decarboxylase